MLNYRHFRRKYNRGDSVYSAGWSISTSTECRGFKPVPDGFSDEQFCEYRELVKEKCSAGRKASDDEALRKLYNK